MADAVVGTVGAAIVAVRFRNTDDGWCVLLLKAEGEDAAGLPEEADPAAFVATGRLAWEPTVGQTVELIGGSWTEHARTGERQLRFEAARLLPLSGREAVVRFLSSGRFPGIGERRAEALYELYGDGVLEVAEREPERLVAARGVTSVMAAAIGAAAAADARRSAVLVELIGLGLGHAEAERVAKVWGPEAPRRVRDAPYDLVEIERIGFRTADRIARGMGVPLGSEDRARAWLLYALAEQADGLGHVWSPWELLTYLAGKEQVSEESLAPAARSLGRDGDVERGGKSLALAGLAGAERGVAAGLRAIATQERLDAHDPPGGFDAEQERALRLVARHGVAVLTGGPGTGKTHTVRGLFDAFPEARVMLAAPTGKAARRLAELAGRDASTIHRLLGWNPAQGRFLRCVGSPLEADIVAVDEASMLDLRLAASLVRAIPARARLLLVGDADQLPPVGPGAVLRDLVGCGAIPVVRLTRIHRQGPGSGLAELAAAVNAGEADLWRHAADLSGQDAEFVAAGDHEAVLAAVERAAADGAMVLCPTKRGPVGVPALNARCQARLNPARSWVDELTRGRGADAWTMRVGDPVIQIRNNYALDGERGVMNGEVGRVMAADPGKRRAVVRFPDYAGGNRDVQYGREELADLQLAYALTIHKAQGSEWQQVAVVVDSGHFFMLARQLLYTAITRPKERLVVIGQPKAWTWAVGNRRAEGRRTGLRAMLTKREA